jgi:hypothetical protein
MFPKYLENHVPVLHVGLIVRYMYFVEKFMIFVRMELGLRKNKWVCHHKYLGYFLTTSIDTDIRK